MTHEGHFTSLVRESDRALMDALDWPDHLKSLQDAYWEKRREWEQVEQAFIVAARFCLEHAENVVEVGKP